MEEMEGHQGISRRRFLMLVGAATVGTVAIPSFILAMDRRAKGEDITGVSYQRLRHWSMIIDLKYCDGCRSQGKPPQCTTACIQGHFVPEPMEWIEIFEYDNAGGGTHFLPAPCMHCQNAPCVSVCPVGATWITPEGVVLIDQGRCIGCRLCMAACPYDRRFFVWGQPPIPPEALMTMYSPEHQVPARKGTVMKCDFCPEMARSGRLPFCVLGCPNKAIYFGDLEEDIATNGNNLIKVSQFLSENSAFRLKEDIGTKPRVYYIPGYGQAVGRTPYDKGRMPTEWPWVEKIKGAEEWTR